MPVSFRVIDLTALADHAEPVIIEHGQLIGDELSFEELFGTHATDVQWETERILVVEEFVSRSRYGIEQESVLDGIYDMGSHLVVRTRSVNYAPCQGIAQVHNVGIEITNLLVVIPRDPAPICYSECRIGDCPPDIP